MCASAAACNPRASCCRCRRCAIEAQIEVEEAWAAAPRHKYQPQTHDCRTVVDLGWPHALDRHSEPWSASRARACRPLIITPCTCHTGSAWTCIGGESVPDGLIFVSGAGQREALRWAGLRCARHGLAHAFALAGQSWSDAKWPSEAVRRPRSRARGLRAEFTKSRLLTVLAGIASVLRSFPCAHVFYFYSLSK